MAFSGCLVKSGHPPKLPTLVEENNLGGQGREEVLHLSFNLCVRQRCLARDASTDFNYRTRRTCPTDATGLLPVHGKPFAHQVSAATQEESNVEAEARE